MKILKHLLLVFASLFASLLIGQVQNRQHELEASKDNIKDALWVKELLSSNPDVGRVSKLYDEYYKTHAFEKNQFTRQYKRWLRSLSHQVLSTPEQDRNYLKQLELSKTSRSGTAAWSTLGPIDWDHTAASVSYAPGSAHVYTVEQSITNPDILFAGTATTGLWKTTDRGLNWIPLTHNLLFNEVYALEIDHTNADVLYFATGKTILKSINGGSTFLNTGDAAFQALNIRVRDIKMHPTNNQILFACTETGFYKTVNGGSNWMLIATGDYREVEVHPTNAAIIYAVKSDGIVTKFYKSTDTGSTLIQTGINWPVPASGDEQRRTEIAVTPAAPNKVFALCGGSNSASGSGLYGVYVSNDMGDNWTFMCCGAGPLGPFSSSDPNILGYDRNGNGTESQYTYDLSLAVSPFNADSIMTCGISLWLSTNGGSSFTVVANWDDGQSSPKYVHADIHDIHYYAHTKEIWIANDGGIFYSNNGGATFNKRNHGIVGTDFWGYGHGWWEGDVMIGGVFHNGTLLKENNVYIDGWLSTDGGDGVGGDVNPGIDKQVYSNYNIKTLKSNRTVAPVTRDFINQPNGSYITGKENDMLFDPRYYGHWITGSGNKLMKTIDDGYSFTVLHDFGIEIAKMDQCWSNLNYIYVCTWPDWFGVKKIWKSTDGGLTFSEITPPPAVLGTVPNWVPFDIAVSDDDPNKIWIVRTSQYGDIYDGSIVYYSSNGGGTWQNISGTALNGQAPTCIYYQKGSNDGVYIGTRRAVYYKDNSMTDWMLYNDGLPAQTLIVKMDAYQRKQKLRAATNRSVWESPLYMNSDVIAQPSTFTDTVRCLTDSISFVDHSIVSDQGVSWSWSFPGGSPSTSTLRTPKVRYTTPGSYSVTLTVTDNNGSSTKTVANMITLTDECSKIDTIPGNVAKFSSNTDYGRIPPLNITTNTFSVSMWIKPEGNQSSFAALLSTKAENGCNFNFRDNNQLGYHWKGGQWWWDGGPVVTPNVWSHVVMVVSPSSTTIYLNGIPYTNNVSNSAANLNQDFIVGRDRDNKSRVFKGLIDEVAIYNKALTIDEVRLLRHLTKIPGNNLIGYYQFNEQKSVSYNKVGNLHAQMGGIRAESTAPVGGGSSQMLNVNSAGLKSYNTPGVQIGFPASSTYPNGNVVVSKINLIPDGGAALGTGLNRYWVINNYGTNASFSLLDSIIFSQYGAYEDCPNSEFLLFKRGDNAEGNTWGTSIDHSDNFNVSSESAVFSTGNNVTSFGQFYMVPDPNENPLQVSQKGNEGIKSLRGVMACAEDGDTITFAANMDTITDRTTNDKNILDDWV